MMKHFAKLIALLLAVVMVVTILPVMASADEAPAETVETVAEPAEQTEETPAEQTPAAEEAPAQEAPAVVTETEEAPAEEPKTETAPAEEVKAEETKTEEVKAEEQPAEQKAEPALETAEKTEPVVGAMTSTASEADAYWSYTTKDGTQTFYYAHIAEAYAKGVHEDPNATSETAGVIKMLKDQTVDQTEPNATGTNSAGTASAATLTTSATATSTAMIDYPFKAINIDFNGHTLTVNTDKTATNGDARATLIRVGKTGVAHNYNIHIYSSAATPGTFTKNANKQALRGLVGDYAGTGTGQRNITVENMNVTTAKSEPLICVAGTEPNVTIKNCVITAPKNSTYAAVEIGAPNATSNPTLTQSLVIENSTINGGRAAIRAANCRTTDAKTYTTNCTCTLTLKGTNTFTCSATDSGASKHGILLATNTAGSWVYNIDPTTVATSGSEALLGWNDETVDSTVTTTVSEVNGEVFSVIFDLGDNPASIDPQSVAEGFSPSVVTVPMYEDGGKFYRFTYWTIEGDATQYASSTDVIVTDDVTLIANYEEFSPVASCTIGDETNYFETLTDAWKAANTKTATIDLYQDVVMDYGSEEKGNTTSTSHTWFDLNTKSNITLNLHGHTIDGGTDDTDYGTSGNKYFDRGIIRFSYVANGTYALTVNGDGGEMITRGTRSIFVFGSTGDSGSLNALDLTVNDTTMRVTNDCNAGDSDRQNTTNFFQVNLLSNVSSISVTLNDCDLLCEYDSTMKNAMISYVFCNYNYSTQGAYPTHFEANGCTFQNINYLANRTTSFTVDKVVYPAITEQQVTFDAATAAEIKNDETMAGKVNVRVRLDDASYDPAIETYVLNPQTMVADTSVPTFALDSLSMTLEDYVYVNVKPNDAWTDDYYVTTTLTNDGALCNGVSRISNLAVSAKDMSTSFVITAYADPTATTRYLTGTSGSIDTFAGLTKTAATEQGLTGATELCAAMDAMMLYGDWAAYNFGITTTPPAAVAAYDTTGIPTMTATGRASTSTTLPGYYGTSAVLGDQLYLKHYFYRVAELNSENTATAATNVEYGKDSSDKFAWIKLKLAPKDYEQSYTVTVTDGGSTYSISGSLAAYAAALAEQSADEREQTLAHALLQYCAAAKAYFDALT